MVRGLRCECKRCGETLESTNGEGLLSVKRDHRVECFPGFTEAEQVDDVPDPRRVR